MSELQEQVRKLEGALGKCVTRNTKLKKENDILAFEADHWREIAYELEFGDALDADQPVPYRVTEKGTATAKAAGLKTRPPNGNCSGSKDPPSERHRASGDLRDGAKTVVVDLDGVLAKYQGWSGEFKPIGIPIVDPEGISARVFCQALQDFGYRIIIHTCRTPRPDGHDDPLAEEQVTTWLDEHNIPYDHLHLGPNKPIAAVYLDDRGVRFTGSFVEALHDIVNMKPHWSSSAEATDDLRESE